MNKDIRVTVGLCDHHKTVKLIRKAGEGAFRCLLRLWCYAAEHRPHGVLSGMDATDIAIASGWHGDEAEWISALVSVGFMDDSGETLALHDWEQHNPFAFHAEERSQKARAAAKAKWEKRNSANRNATSINEHSGEQEEAERQARSSNAPSPSPIPSPSPLDSVAKATGAAAPQSDADWLWAEGVSYLCSHNVPERQARSQIGKWRKHGDGIARAAVQAAMAQGTRDPIPFIEKAVSARGAGSLSEDAAHAAFIEEQRRLWSGTGLPL